MQSGSGLSFSEFTYPLLQGYDWWHMYSHFQLNGVQVQIGGSDQYGNIMAGIDVVNCIRRNHHEPKFRQETDEFLDRPMGFTVPLLTTAAGEKFGKTAGNAIWLDKEMTSAFDLYQFFLRSSDDDVHRYLKLFTFIPLPNISTLMAEHQTNPSKRLAQRTLAREALEVIHGKTVATETEAQHKLMFSNKPLQTAYPRPPFAPTPENSNPREIESSQHSKPFFKNPYSKAARATYMNPILNPSAGPTPPLPSASVTLPRSLVHNQSMSRIFHSAGLVSSRSEGHRLLSAHGAYVGSKPGIQHGNMPDHVEYTRAQNWDPQKTEEFLLGEGKDLLVLRAGKWRVKVVKVVEDEIFEREERDAPGWRERKEEMARENAGKEAVSGKRIMEEKGDEEQKKEKEEGYARSVIRKVVQGEDPRMRSLSWENPPPAPAS
ncbi:MAG: hypothetical protein Q9167_003499 [Letrouitia subvulpina]